MRRQTVTRMRHALSWVLVVIVTATVTTLVVGRVGEDVAGELTTAPPLQSGSTSVPTTTPPTTPPISSRPTSPAAEPGTPSPDGPEPTSARATPSADDGGHESGRTPSPTRTTPSPSGGPTRTYSTRGGAVVAGCRGSRPYAKSVTPRYGFAFKTESDEHELTVKFTRPGTEYTLHIACRSGTPVLAEGDGHED